MWHGHNEINVIQLVLLGEYVAKTVFGTRYRAIFFTYPLGKQEHMPRGAKLLSKDPQLNDEPQWLYYATYVAAVWRWS